MALTDSFARLKWTAPSAFGLGALWARGRRQWLHCLPQRLRVWLAARQPELVIVPRDEDKAEVFRDILGERQLIGALDRHAPESATAIGAGDKPAWRHRILELPAERVLTRRLILPAQVRDNLRQVLTYELDRLTPFSADAVFFDARVAAVLARGSKIEVELALCPRTRADSWLASLRALATPVTKLTWPGAWEEANLLPVAARPRPRRLPWLLAWLLGLLVVALLAAVLITPLWQHADEQTRLRQAMRGLSTRAEEVSQVREALERARYGSVAVLERKRAHPKMTELMLELTELLPDGTWVQTLNYNDGSVDLRGESTQATALIGILERGPGISNVTFRSPVMQISADGGERFHIAFDYRTAEAP